MNMTLIDWLIPAGIILGLLAICISVSRLTQSVSDFLSANRMAGRYLLSIGSGMTGLGAITIAANFEKYYQAGFAAYWWAQIGVPVMLVISLSGFVTYRYRETRALTMPQFFEMRYSHNFRIFSGILAWSSGILNYGIFPAVSARFIIYFTGLPEQTALLGFSIPTLAIVMFVLLSIALIMVMLGGQISIMITDMLQGQFVNIVLIIVLGVLFWHMSWGDVLEGLRNAPANESRINPFKQANVSDFNVWFFIMMAILQVYSYRSWLGSQGYFGAARSPHEARMAGILGEFRGMVATLVILLVPIMIFAYLHLPGFAEDARIIEQNIATIPDAQIQKQMLVPMSLGQILPVGVMGMFAAVVLIAAVSTDNTYLHSWGSIFVQDVVMPLRKSKKSLSPRAHMWLLRLSILSVSVFAFFWGLLFPLNEYIYMYFQITGAIYLGGAGSVLIGGLYWKRGTTGGAWAAMITGSLLAVCGILLRNIIWPHFLPKWKNTFTDSGFLQNLPDAFPFNGMEMSFFAAGMAVAAYVLVSLLSKTPPANMEKLLHRGKYAVGHDHDTALQAKVEREALAQGATQAEADALGATVRKPLTSRLWKRLGVGAEFTASDKFIYLFKLLWAAFFIIVFIVGTTLNAFWQIPDTLWEKWWGFMIAVTLILAVITIFWFLWGGFRDLFALMRSLRSVIRDSSDDGSVSEAERAQLTAVEIEKKKEHQAD